MSTKKKTGKLQRIFEEIDKGFAEALPKGKDLKRLVLVCYAIAGFAGIGFIAFVLTYLAPPAAAFFFGVGITFSPILREQRRLMTAGSLVSGMLAAPVAYLVSSYAGLVGAVAIALATATSLFIHNDRRNFRAIGEEGKTNDTETESFSRRPRTAVRAFLFCNPTEGSAPGEEGGNLLQPPRAAMGIADLTPQARASSRRPCRCRCAAGIPRARAQHAGGMRRAAASRETRR